ncbi:bifunctional heptose 7-phosphate kinase/heptose 1-phosphate adenyltransferase [Candidatus Hydrogenedentota bacterium]
MNRERLSKILKNFGKARVLLVGDICLDKWCYYDPQAGSESRETGMTIHAIVRKDLTPGGGGNTLWNLADAGAREVRALGLIGDDGEGYDLKKALLAKDINVDFLFQYPGFQTYTFTKILNADTGIEDVPRVDFINRAVVTPEIEAEMLAALDKVLPLVDAVVVADYSESGSESLFTDALVDKLSALAAANPEKVFVVDSRERISHYHHMILKPNEVEMRVALEDLTGEKLHLGAEELVEAVGRLGEELRVRMGGDEPLYVTLGEKGVMLFEGGEPDLIHTAPVAEPVDICGAGDTFISALTLALWATQKLDGKPDYRAAAEIGNLAASITIMKKGTGTATPEEMLHAV